ncbi:DUF2339 domain-containing protein [Mesorhizobium sp. BAC0120]|uniref:DUF2339 domain-containing protein n=1 Tax=Mesorhizobium sp. BAC0120 TaxID=3090670 RepID=UPI00298C5C8F|nr:DUF2339 domain-containing protein [Mesorhizobium sp. BAC0120]MDW6021210.1 DUF2339 domain-containing protein [Mesorhizobium sp. BAC0120]
MFGEFGELVGLVAIVALIAGVRRQQRRLRVLETDLKGLRTDFLAYREAVTSKAAVEVSATPESTAAQQAVSEQPARPEHSGAALGDAVDASPPEAKKPAEPAIAAAAPERPADRPVAEVDAQRPAGPTVETALGTRWAVWVGGLALALGGIFLVRYTIEAGIFGPEVRLILASILGIALVAAGEIVRRTGFRVPVEGVANAHVPGILTAAGAFTLFGAVYAAHGIYGFIGPTAAFLLLGMIGIATIVASLIHGQALAGVGVVGSYLTPVLVSTQAPNHWALFGFVAIVLAAAAFIARLRDWLLLMAAAFAGAGLWTLVYLISAWPLDFAILSFITAVTLVVLEFVWLGRRQGSEGFDIPSIVPAFFVAVTSAALFLDPDIAAAGGVTYGAIFLVAMVAVAVYRAPAIALLHAAGTATTVVYLRSAFSGSFNVNFLGEEVRLEGFPLVGVGQSEIVWSGVALSAAFLVAGLWSAWSLAPSAARRAAAWSAWGVAVPLVVLFATWIAFGNLDRDVARALIAFALAVAFALAGEVISRAELPWQTGGPAVSVALIGAGIAVLLALHMGFSSGWTTVLLGAATALPAFATRYRNWPVLGWLSAGAVAFLLLRFALDPTIVGAANLSTTPFLNWLLIGYGVPAIGAGFAGWQLARTTNGRARLVMEAAASFFTLIGAAMLVRHAMHGGVIDDSAITLAEQAVYTLIALAGSAMLIALDRRAPSPVLRFGSIAVGILSAAMIVLQHLLLLDPLFTDESTGKIPVLNLLLLAYLMPAAAAGGLALFARGRRPRWYVATLGLIAAMLAFAYATLSLRRLFQGEFIGAWREFGQLETYAYSALWLALGVALLVGGLALRSQVLRLASGALIVIAVAKVFLFDMSELEGVLRALSFIGLGVVLIGIGLFYQRMLRLGVGAASREQAATPAPPTAS